MSALALRPGHAWSYQPGNYIPIRAVETRGVGTLSRLTAGRGSAPIAISSSSFYPLIAYGRGRPSWDIHRRHDRLKKFLFAFHSG